MAGSLPWRQAIVPIALQSWALAMGSPRRVVAPGAGAEEADQEEEILMMVRKSAEKSEMPTPHFDEPIGSQDLAAPGRCRVPPEEYSRGTPRGLDIGRRNNHSECRSHPGHATEEWPIRDPRDCPRR